MPILGEGETRSEKITKAKRSGLKTFPMRESRYEQEEIRYAGFASGYEECLGRVGQGGR